MSLGEGADDAISKKSYGILSTYSFREKAELVSVSQIALIFN